MDEDFFWGDLLAHIRRRDLVTVVGPDVTLVEIDGREQTFTSVIGQRLLEIYRLTPESEVTKTADAVELILSQKGRGEVYRLYRFIYEIINERVWTPGRALRDLAAIADLRLFVSTTPDQLLATAINEIRFGGRQETRELSFSPSTCTSLQRENQSEGSPTDTVVLSLFGKAESTTPQYAIHDEDLLEWLCALLSEASSFPEWLSAPLKRRSTLFIGYDIPDWIGRYLMRISGDARLSQLNNQQFFFVGSPGESPLLSFLSEWCPENMVQQLGTEPTAFAEKLHKRWEEESSKWPADRLDDPRKQDPRPAPPQGPPSIFISYMREDGDAARRLTEAITRLGGDVWFDENRLRPGDPWEPEILSRIKRDVQLFVPVISANTEREKEGFVFKEWNAAVDRAQGMVNRRFIVPVVIENDLAGDPNGLRGIPSEFLKFSFGRAPGGDPDESLRGMLTDEIRNMRSPAI